MISGISCPISSGQSLSACFLYGLYYFSSGKAIGGGDIKLMAYAGLLLGAKNIIFAFILACILGSVIQYHPYESKQAKQPACTRLSAVPFGRHIHRRTLGQPFLTWYLGMMGIY